MGDEDRWYEAQRVALSRAVALTGITATLSFPLAFYARSAAPDITNVPIISPDGRGYYMVALLVTIAIGAIVHALQTDDPATRTDDAYVHAPQRGNPGAATRLGSPATAWMLPVVALFASYLFLAIYHRLAFVLLVPLVAAGVVFASRVARYHVLNVSNATLALARIGHVVLTYGVAFAALCIVYMFKARSLYSGTAVFVIAFLLLLQLLDGFEATLVNRILYAALAAVGLAQMTWALNYWNTSAWFGGAILTTLFVFAGSIARGRMRDDLTQRMVLERASVAAIVFIALTYFAE